MQRGAPLRIVVSAYRELEIHLHGYDIERVAAPGHPAVIALRPGDLGTFDLEAHDDRVPRLAQIEVVR